LRIAGACRPACGVGVGVGVGVVASGASVQSIGIGSISIDAVRARARQGQQNVGASPAINGDLRHGYDRAGIGASARRAEARGREHGPVRRSPCRCHALALGSGCLFLPCASVAAARQARRRGCSLAAGGVMNQ